MCYRSHSMAPVPGSKVNKSSPRRGSRLACWQGHLAGRTGLSRFRPGRSRAPCSSTSFLWKVSYKVVFEKFLITEERLRLTLLAISFRLVDYSPFSGDRLFHFFRVADYSPFLGGRLFPFLSGDRLFTFFRVVVYSPFLLSVFYKGFL